MTIQAEATAVSPAEIGDVYFYDDDTFLGYDYSTPFELSWTPNTLGVHSLTGGADDSFGGEALTEITVNVVSVPPLDISFYSHWTSRISRSISPRLLVANVENIFGVLDRIDFYVNGTFIGNGSSDSVTWTPSAVGDYMIEAYAYGSNPSQNGNQVITVHVAELHPPVVQLSSPRATVAPSRPARQFSSKRKSAMSMGISRFSNSRKTETPLGDRPQRRRRRRQFTWENASPGWHSVDAVATDTTESSRGRFRSHLRAASY